MSTPSGSTLRFVNGPDLAVCTLSPVTIANDGTVSPLGNTLDLILTVTSVEINFRRKSRNYQPMAADGETNLIYGKGSSLKFEEDIIYTPGAGQMGSQLLHILASDSFSDVTDYLYVQVQHGGQLLEYWGSVGDGTGTLNDESGNINCTLNQLRVKVGGVWINGYQITPNGL